MTAEELQKLLDEATPGPWVADQEIEKYWGVVQSGNWLNDVADRVPRGPDARLIALAPTLARKVIAAEKLVEAVRRVSFSDNGIELFSALAAWEAAQ